MTFKTNNLLNKNTNKFFLILVCLSLILITARLTPTIQIVKQLAYSILVPNLKIASNSFKGTGNLVFNISNIIRVNQENLKLNGRILELSEQLRDYQALLNDNTRLNLLLNLSPKKELTPIFANVIIREPSQWYQWIIINKGLKDGIRPDLAVVSVLNDGQICAFGRIAEVYNSTSKVALITNSLSSIPVQIKDSTTDCLIDGYNSQYMKLNYIPQTVKVNINDEIVTSPISSVFDRGIKIGRIIKIVKNYSGGYSNVTVIPYYQNQRIYEVAVLLPKKELK